MPGAGEPPNPAAPPVAGGSAGALPEAGTPGALPEAGTFGPGLSIWRRPWPGSPAYRPGAGGGAAAYAPAVWSCCPPAREPCPGMARPPGPLPS